MATLDPLSCPTLAPPPYPPAPQVIPSADVVAQASHHAAVPPTALPLTPLLPSP